MTNEDSEDESDPELLDQMGITEDEVALLRQARELDNPAVIDSNIDALTVDAREFDELTLVKEERFETNERRMAEVQNRLAEAMREQSDLRGDTISALSFEALWDEFTDHGENVPELSVLSQKPEAGGIGEDEEEGPTADDINEIESLLSRADMMERHAPGHAESLRSDAADLAGVESHEKIDLEVL